MIQEFVQKEIIPIRGKMEEVHNKLVALGIQKGQSLFKPLP